jgi:hypothetical protein
VEQRLGHLHLPVQTETILLFQLLQQQSVVVVVPEVVLVFPALLAEVVL